MNVVFLASTPRHCANSADAAVSVGVSQVGATETKSTVQTLDHPLHVIGYELALKQVGHGYHHVLNRIIFEGAGLNPKTADFLDISKRMEATVDVPARVECCPSETHFIHPRGGISRDGKLLEIYRDHRTVQKFYQTACKPDVQDQPCQFIKRKYKPASRCAQKFSYVYAFVRDFNVSESFRLDYIRVKSGCSCELDVTLHEEIDLS